MFLTAACCPRWDFYTDTDTHTHTHTPPHKNGNRLLYCSSRYWWDADVMKPFLFSWMVIYEVVEIDKNAQFFQTDLSKKNLQILLKNTYFASFRWPTFLFNFFVSKFLESHSSLNNNLLTCISFWFFYIWKIGRKFNHFFTTTILLAKMRVITKKLFHCIKFSLHLSFSQYNMNMIYCMLMSWSIKSIIIRV